jgi:hypothetical protein
LTALLFRPSTHDATIVSLLLAPEGDRRPPSKSRSPNCSRSSGCSTADALPLHQRAAITPHAWCSSGPAARSASTRVVAQPPEREPGALAGRLGSGRQQAHRRHPQTRQRREPPRPITTPDRRGRADAHLWRRAGLVSESTLGPAFVLARVRRSGMIALFVWPVTARKGRTPHMRRRPSQSPLRIGSGSRPPAAFGGGWPSATGLALRAERVRARYPRDTPVTRRAGLGEPWSHVSYGLLHAYSGSAGVDGRRRTLSPLRRAERSAPKMVRGWMRLGTCMSRRHGDLPG